MKECKYCGSVYNDELNACPNCGGTLIVSEEERAEEAAYRKREIENRERAAVEASKYKKRLCGIAIGAVVLIVIIIGSIIGAVNRPLSNGMSKEEANAVLEEGISYYKLGDYENALECFNQLPNDSKQYLKAQSLAQKSADTYCAAVIEKANKYAQDGNYTYALKLIGNAQKLLPENEMLNNCFWDTTQTYISKVISAADDYASKGDYEAAHNALDEAISALGEYSNLTDKLAEIENQAIMSEVKIFEDQKDYVSLVAYLQKLVEENTDYQPLLNQYEKKLVSVTMDQTKKLAEKREFKKAISIIENAQTVYDCGEFQTAIEEYTNLLPKNLTECHVVDRSYYSYVEDEVEDSFGGKHKDSLVFNLMWGDTYIIYNLDGKYATLSGTMAAINGYSSIGVSKIEIYLDDELAYTSPSIKATTEPFKFKVDVSGAKCVKIVGIGADSSWNDYAIVDATVS